MGIATAEIENKLSDEAEAKLRDQEAVDNDPDYEDWLEEMATQRNHRLST